jgi:hypothetical protein
LSGANKTPNNAPTATPPITPKTTLLDSIIVKFNVVYITFIVQISHQFLVN